MSDAKALAVAQESRITSTVLESLVLYGDISALNKEQRVEYYSRLCERVGLDPATTPFLPIKLNGKEQLYAGKGCAEQLRKLHRVSVTITSRERVDDVYCVTARTTLPDGRTDESIGAVFIGSLKGEYLANAIMKTETKAKRRATLSIVGLGGMLDESEVEDLGPDRFSTIPQEAPKTNVVNMPPPKAAPAEKLETARAAVEKPRRADRDGDGLPQPTTWTPAQPIPTAIRMVVPGFAQLEMPVSEMTIDQLECVVEQCAHAYERWKEDPRYTEKQLNLINRIGSSASSIHYARTNNGGSAA